ncbi:unnamed protein product [Durusdinium trenchii]|uniref:Uncharacterized protein n=1 Tax=Durusdinium trenchii TaxID=1381693 RepID=A0ABP0Q5I5_9DINO
MSDFYFTGGVHVRQEAVGLNRHTPTSSKPRHRPVPHSQQTSNSQRRWMCRTVRPRVCSGDFACRPRRSEPGRLEVASLTARAVWLQQRPGSRWELLPHYCQVVQGRRAQHHGQKWLQVTTRLALEERWLSRSKEDLRVREHFVVYELPREGAIVQDFRIAAILPDAEPAKE